jgi:dolichol-phosphate mannosyltransferase
MNTTVILPARNEADVIAKMCTMLLLLYPKYIKQIIVVDDGSTDRTAEIVTHLSKNDKRIILVKRKSPHGVGLAIRDGIKAVPQVSDYILSMDADFIRNLPDLDDFFTLVPKYDGLVGSRYLRRHSLIRYPLVKRIFNRLFHLLVRISFNVRQHDLTNNFKLYKKSVFGALPLSASNFAINAEIGLYPVLLGYKIRELPVTWYAREDGMGSSKFNLVKVAASYFAVYLKASRYSDTLVARMIKFFLPQTSGKA